MYDHPLSDQDNDKDENLGKMIETARFDKISLRFFLANMPASDAKKLKNKLRKQQLREQQEKQKQIDAERKKKEFQRNRNKDDAEEEKIKEDDIVAEKLERVRAHESFAFFSSHSSSSSSVKNHWMKP